MEATRTSRRTRLMSLSLSVTLVVPAMIATAGVAMAQDDAKFCTGTDIVFFPGGPRAARSRRS